MSTWGHDMTVVLTSGWPRGSTLGPWSEWQDTISTSAGRYFSKAAISGALQEVCPPTMAPCLVATQGVRRWHWRDHINHTRTVFSNNLANWGSFDIVDGVITCSGNEMAIGKNCNLFLCTSQHKLHDKNYLNTGHLLYLQTLHTKLHTCPPYRRRLLCPKNISSGRRLNVTTIDLLLASAIPKCNKNCRSSLIDSDKIK